MLLKVDDFAHVLDELDSMVIDLEVTHVTPSNASCPRCVQPMESCRVVRGKKNPKTPVLHCRRHGLWFGPGQLAAWISLVAREGAGGGEYGTRPAQGLAISAWWDKPRPRIHTLMTSPYHGQRLGCPTCNADLQFAGARWGCVTCAGSFVENAPLEAMVAEMHHSPWHLPACTGVAGPKSCPVCREPMVKEDLGPVAIDRCGNHGLWFDATELAAVLEYVGDPPHGIRAWLKRLF